MGTSNFKTPNTSYTYATLMGDVEEWELDYLISNLRTAFESLSNSNTDLNFIESDRFYEIGSLYICKPYGDIDLEYRIELTTEEGYYEGLQLDIEEEYHSYSDYIDEMFEYEPSDMSEGLRAMLRLKADNWLKNKREDIVSEIEKIYKQHSAPLTTLGRASNGETFYLEVKDENSN